MLSGPACSPSQDQSLTGIVAAHTLRVDGIQQDTKMLDDRLKSFWELESLGIVNPDRSVHDDFEDTVRFKDGRYEVCLPWKDPHPTLPDNYHLSLKRLRGQDQSLLSEYNSIIRNQIKEGVVEVVERPEHSENDKVPHLPHHAVIQWDKRTSKLRIVYDASVKSDGPSLNGCLHTGPKFDHKIMDILLGFRVHRVAVTADIEKAFLMVSVTKGDRDALRFLWVDDPAKDQLEPVVLRFARLVFGVSASPLLLSAIIRHHLEKYPSAHPDLMQKLLQSMYVDDIVTGAEDEVQAHKLYKESKEILMRGGFKLRKFTTNLSQLHETVDRDEVSDDPQPPSLDPERSTESEESYAKSTLGSSQEPHAGEQKVLGVCWDIGADRIVVAFDEIAHAAGALEPTKRNIVSLVGKFYDPLGLISPVIVQYKMLFQELCEANLDWDEPLSGRLLARWRSLTTGLLQGQPFSIPRCYLSGVIGETTSCALYGFCDASLGAYAAVVYLRITADTGHSVKFVAAKTRVSPMNGQTIPRLELLSALLPARLVTNVARCLELELPLKPSHCFTDCKVTLFWIQGVEKDWKPFVQNCVSEIRRLLPVDCWSHCSGRDNPADLPSRGVSPLELLVNPLWQNGPYWLRDVEVNSRQRLSMPEGCFAELKIRDRSLVHGLLVTKEPTGLGQIMRCEDFSSLTRLLAVTARLLKFVRILRNKVHHESGDQQEGDGYSKAETLWIIESQSLLVKDRKFDDWKKQLGLFLDQNGVWRCRGRISNADLPFLTKHPVLLHRDHYLTKLFVRRAHERVLHNGVKDTLTELRSKFWIVKGRSFVRCLVHQCTICRRFVGKPYQGPPPPPLPTFRVRVEPPFTFTGVDFAGPLYVKSGDTTKKKVWICLYTCCVVRAVHLDLVPDMTTAAFLRSLKRFIARRGLPRKIVSDNGKTFKAAAKAIRRVMAHGDVKEYLAGIGVEWVFNLPKAPWWGGVFERMIGSTKLCLRKIIGQANLSYDELLTAITEVEMVINSRPLSYISADDLDEPLTPSHLIVGRHMMSLPDHISTLRVATRMEWTTTFLTKERGTLTAP